MNPENRNNEPAPEVELFEAYTVEEIHERRELFSYWSFSNESSGSRPAF